MKTKKIAIKIWAPTAEKMEKRFEALFLRRDAFLNYVLRIEISRLKECQNEQNLPEVYQYIQHELNQLDRKTVAFSFDEELITEIELICKEKNIVRDAFYNRVLLLLVASHEQVRRLLGLNEGWDEQFKAWLIDKTGLYLNPEFYPLTENHTDPFFFLHDYLQEFDDDTNIYSKVFGIKQFKNTNLAGLNCFLPSLAIPEKWQSEETKRDLADF